MAACTRHAPDAMEEQRKNLIPKGFWRLPSWSAQTTLNRLQKILVDGDPAVRYWGAVACSASDTLPKSVEIQLRKMFEDPSKAVAIEAANAVARHTADAAALQALVRWFDDDDRTIVLHAARAIELIADPRSKDSVHRLATRYQDEPGDLAWFIRFSTNGYLSRQN